MDVLPIFQTFGIPLGLLLIVLAGGWRAGRWLAANVLRPLTAAHIDFLGTLSMTQQQQSDTLKTIAQTQERQAKLQEDHTRELHALRQTMEGRRPGGCTT